MTSLSDPVIIIGAGQSGLAAARAARDAGLDPVVLEAGTGRSGSWPSYYDSLTLFSPARYSSMPGFPFPGDPDRYPTRDEVAAYLDSYADHVGVEVRTGTRVDQVSADGSGFVVHTAGGEELPASGVVAASGSFGNPHTPRLPGQDTYTGDILHVADYRSPAKYSGQRVVVVGAGNSAIQVAHELADHAAVTVATLRTPAFVSQVVGGQDLHHWFGTTGFDRMPGAWLAGPPLVLDTGDYQNAYDAGRLDQRPMFSSLDGDSVVWADGRTEHTDTVILATGYRPDLGYLRSLGALDDTGYPRHVGGISTTHPGLVYVGLEFQRSFSSNTLRGVSRDADDVIAPLTAYARGAFGALGL